MTRKRAVLYCRVSSDEQAKGCSLDHQEKELREWCLKNNADVVEVFREDYSAKTLDRPELRKAMKKYMRRSSDVDIFIVLRWNRLSRNAEDGNRLIKDFRKCGVEVNAKEEWIDHTVSESKIMLGLYLSMAEVDNDKRSRATSDGIHATLLRGRWASKAPKGYVNVNRGDYDKYVEVDPVQSRFVIKAFNEVAKGIKTPTMVWRELKSQGFRCGETTFFEILRNRFYVGDVFVPAYNDDPDQYVKGVHVPLIDGKTFEQVQDVLAPTKKRKRNRFAKKVDAERGISKMPKPEFYLHGFMACPECGAKVYASFSKGRHNRYPYYHCNKCGKYRMRADVVNYEFEAMLNALKPKENIKKLFSEIFCDVSGESKQDITAKKENIQNEMAAIQNKLNKVQDMLLEDKISTEDFSAISDRLKKEMKQHHERLDDLQSLPSESEIVSKMEKSSAILDHLGDFLRQLSVNERIDICGSILSEKMQFSKERTRTIRYKDIIYVICENPMLYAPKNKIVPSENSDSTTRCPKPGSNRHVF